MVRQRYLAGLGRRATADHRRVRDGRVGIPERPGLQDSDSAGEHSRHGCDRGDLQRLDSCQRREDSGEPPCEHRLSSSGGANQDDVVRARRCDLVRALHVLLALHLGEVIVDIVVVLDQGQAVTINVKGLAGTTSWPVDKVGEGTPGHFIVLVGYAGKIADPGFAPEVYIVSSDQLAEVTYVSPKGRRVVQLGRMRRTGTRYRDAWHLLINIGRAA